MRYFLTFIIIISGLGVFGQDDPLEKVFGDPEFMPALEQLMGGNHDSCLTLLNKFDENHPKYESVVYIKSQCHFEQRKWDELKTDLEYILPKIKVEDSNYSNLINLYGISLRNTNEKDKAIKTFKEAYKNTQEPIHLINLIALYNELQEFDESIKYESKLNQDTIGNLHFLLGEAFYYLSKYDKAEQYLNKYLDKHNDLVKFQTYFYMGKMKEESCKYYNLSDSHYSTIPKETIDSYDKYEVLRKELQLELSKCK